jgi:hypothetical protein
MSQRKGHPIIGCSILLLILCAGVAGLVHLFKTPANINNNTQNLSTVPASTVETSKPHPRSNDFSPPDEKIHHVNSYTRKDGTQVRAYNRR